MARYSSIAPARATALIQVGDLDACVSDMIATAGRHLGIDLTIVSDTVSTQGSPPQTDAGTGPRNGLFALPLMLSTGKRWGTLVLSDKHDVDSTDGAMRALRLLVRLLEDRVEKHAAEVAEWRALIANTGVQALLAALAARDGYTKEHSEAVVQLSARTAERMGLAGTHLDEVRQVALLHDLGKIALPEPLLQKPAALEEEEWQLMREHPAIGARIVSSVETLAHLAPAIRAAHERWDGGGYPDGLVGSEIPLASRIVSLCDAYDAMISHRPYRAPLPHDVAMRELTRGAGTQFCPSCADAVTEVA